MRFDERFDEAAFDAGLDAYQERCREEAAALEDLGDRQAVRPEADRATVTFGDLIVGDYMTAEAGPHARWVEVVALEPRRKWSNDPAPGWVTVTFQTPQPIGVALEDRWVIERHVGDAVIIDQSVREGSRL